LFDLIEVSNELAKVVKALIHAKP